MFDCVLNFDLQRLQREGRTTSDNKKQVMYYIYLYFTDHSTILCIVVGMAVQANEYTIVYLSQND